MHPILIRIGSFQLPTFGVLLAAAIVLAVYTIVRLGRREGLDTGRLVDFSTWLLVVGVVGAKVLMIVTDWRTYWVHPGELFSWATLQAAGVYYGGFLAATFFACPRLYEEMNGAPSRAMPSIGSSVPSKTASPVLLSKSAINNVTGACGAAG